MVGWTCFKTIQFEVLSGELSWLRTAEQKFKDSVEKFVFDGTNAGKNLNLSDLNEYKNLSILKLIPYRGCESTILISDISSLEFLEEIYIINVNVIDLRYLPLNKIKTLQLINCNVSSIYYLKDCFLLEYLKLNQNPLQELSYGENGDSMRSIGILVNLRNNYCLRNLFIEGNMFNDTQELKELSWTEKSGF